MPKLSYLDRNSMAPAARAAMEGRPLANLFRVSAHAETMLPGFLAMGDAVHGGLALEPTLRELCILRVAALTRTAYVMHHHRGLAATLGLTDALVAAAAQDGPDDVLTRQQRTVLAFTDAVVNQVKAPTFLTDALLADLGEQQVMELLMLIGLYGMVTRILQNGEVELEQPGFRASPDTSGS